MKKATALCLAHIAMAATGLPALADGVSASDYPNKSIRVVVPFAAAGVTDIVTRILFDQIGQRLGQPVIIDNRPGAGGNIAVDQVAKSSPDGYTLVVADPSSSLPANVTLFPKLTFHPVKFGPDCYIRNHGCSGDRDQFAAGKIHSGICFLSEEQAGRIDLRFYGKRYAGPSQRRAVLKARRNKNRPCTLSRWRARHDRSHCRPDFILDRSHPYETAAGQ